MVFDVKTRIINHVLGLVGATLLIVCCAFIPTIAVWAALYSPVWVYLGLFIVMMVAGALLNKGIEQIRTDFQIWRLNRKNSKKLAVDEAGSTDEIELLEDIENYPNLEEKDKRKLFTTSRKALMGVSFEDFDSAMTKQLSVISDDQR